MELKEDLRRAVAGSLRDTLAPLLEGVAEDLDRYTEEISVDLTNAMLANDLAWREELVRQAEMLAETHRLRVANGMTAMFGQVIYAVLNAVSGGLVVGLRQVSGRLAEQANMEKSS